MGPIQSLIEHKLNSAFTPTYLEVENESHMHGGSASESHFKVTIVSEKFIEMPLLQRHRSVNQVLREELDGAIHALAMHTYTPEQWGNVGKAPDSPDCRGGSKHI